jgi:cobalt-zinc-cadmium efflux system protein
MEHAHDLRLKSRRHVTIVFFLTLSYMVVEAVGGWLTNSLALLSDAGHMLTDAGALGLAMLAFWLASRPMSPKHNFGLYRAEILAAFINGMVLLLLAGIIIREAYIRLGNPPLVKYEGMLVISGIGLLVNIAGAYILSGGHKENLNLRGALFHVAGDALGSVGAIAAALIIMFTGWLKADPIVSFIIATIIIVGAVRLVTDSTHIILEGTPKEIDLVAVESAMLAHPRVTNVHDLHVWTITSGFESLAAHVVLSEEADDSDCILSDLGQTLMEKFNIAHTTIQIERERCSSNACTTCPAREENA